jgi:flagellar biosynthesis protein FliQ
MRNTSGMLQTSISPKVQATTVISMAITLVIGLTLPLVVLAIWLGILASVILGCLLTQVESRAREVIPKAMGDLLTLARDVELTDTDEQFRLPSTGGNTHGTDESRSPDTGPAQSRFSEYRVMESSL